MPDRPSIPPDEDFPPPYEYPPVDIVLFSHSVGETRILIQQADKLLDKLGVDEFATKLMELAQEGKKESVNQMLHTVIESNITIKTDYTPTGVTFTLRLPTGNSRLSIGLQWGQ